MIERQQAKQIASEWLRAHPAEGTDGALDYRILDDQTLEIDFGWIFFYQSKRFLETRDLGHAIAGNAPVIVDRRDGSVHSTGTAYPVEHYVQEYRRKREMMGQFEP